MSVSRIRARADRVNAACDLGELLQGYGYAVVSDPHREQQFSCDLHGPDHKPSARYYPESNSTYCWPCAKKRDPVEWVKEKEQVNFIRAIEILEERLQLPTLPWSDAEPDKPVDHLAEHDRISSQGESYLDIKARVQRLLEMITEDRGLACNDLLTFWEVFDRIDYGVARQGWDVEQGSSGLTKLRASVIKRLEATA